MVTWEERRPRHLETCKIIWAKWYAELIGQDSTIGVYNQFIGGDRMAFDIGDRLVLLGGYPEILVLNDKQ